MKYGSAIPLDGGGYAVMVICPNEGSFQRLQIDLEAIEPAAFAPDLAMRRWTAAEIALLDGEPSATGGGMATHVVETPPAPPLSPALEAQLERAEAAEDVLDALNVDKPEAGA